MSTPIGALKEGDQITVLEVFERKNGSGEIILKVRMEKTGAELFLCAGAGSSSSAEEQYEHATTQKEFHGGYSCEPIRPTPPDRWRLVSVVAVDGGHGTNRIVWFWERPAR